MKQIISHSMKYHISRNTDLLLFIHICNCNVHLYVNFLCRLSVYIVRSSAACCFFLSIFLCYLWRHQVSVFHGELRRKSPTFVVGDFLQNLTRVQIAFDVIICVHDVTTSLYCMYDVMTSQWVYDFMASYCRWRH